MQGKHTGKYPRLVIWFCFAEANTSDTAHEYPFGEQTDRWADVTKLEYNPDGFTVYNNSDRLCPFDVILKLYSRLNTVNQLYLAAIKFGIWAKVDLFGTL